MYSAQVNYEQHNKRRVVNINVLQTGSAHSSRASSRLDGEQRYASSREREKRLVSETHSSSNNNGNNNHKYGEFIHTLLTDNIWGKSCCRNEQQKWGDVHDWKLKAVYIGMIRRSLARQRVGGQQEPLLIGHLNGL